MNSYKGLFLFGMLLLAAAQRGAAQDALRGLVSNGNGAPVAGATVQARELGAATVTDSTGHYVLTLPAGKPASGRRVGVQVQSVGYQPAQALWAPGTTRLNFVLQPDYLLLEGVEITSLKRPVAASLAPNSASVVRGSLAEAAGASTVAELVPQAPGVTTTQLDEAYLSVQIRGISSLSGDAPAGYYIDHMPLSFIGSPLAPDISPFDLQQVEVLRGPQGTLYGNGGESGIVRILLNDPVLSRVAGKASLSTAHTKGGGDSYTGQGMLNLPLLTDRLGLRLTGGYINRGGFLTNKALGRKNINEQVASYFRAKLLYRPTERLSVGATYMWQKNDVGTNALADSSYDHSTPFDEANYNELSLYNANLRYQLPAVELFSATSYSKMNAVQNDGSPIFARSDTKLGQDAVSEEFRVQSRLQHRFSWLAGAYYWSGQFTQTTGITLAPAPGMLTTVPYLDTKTNAQQWSLFGEGSLRLPGDKVTVTAGLRYFSEERTLEDRDPATVAFLKQQNIEAKRKADFHAVSPRFHLAYKPSPRVSLYATVANGFRSGFVQSGAFYAPAVAFGQPAPMFVDKEDLWSYELGAKLRTKNNRFGLEAAVYRNDWRNLIQTTSKVFVVGGAPTVIIYYLNTGKATATGLDLSMQYAAGSGLTFTLGGNVNRSVYADSTPASIGAKKGDRISFVPEYTLFSSAHYVHALSRKLTGSVLAGFQQCARRVDYNAGTMVKGDETSLLNLRAGVEQRHWGVYLFANNLFNERGATYPSTQLKYYTRLRPTTIGLDVKLNF